MIAGNAVPVNTGSFANDMSTFHTEDDVLTLLIHLGYVSYDYDNKTVKIPNEEVRTEYVNSISASTWGEVSKALKESADTLEAIWQKRPKQVAEAVRQAHFETSHIQYNDENAIFFIRYPSPDFMLSTTSAFFMLPQLFYILFYDTFVFFCLFIVIHTYQ